MNQVYKILKITNKENKIFKIFLFFPLIKRFYYIETKHKKSKTLHHSSQFDNSADLEIINKKHISDMVIGNPNSMVKDRSPLWKDFKDKKFERPFMVNLLFFYYLY